MIIELIGKARELVKDYQTGSPILRFDKDGRARISSMQMPPAMFQKFRNKYKHIVISRSSEDGMPAEGTHDNEVTKAGKARKQKSKPKRVEKQKQKPEKQKKPADKLDDMTEDELRKLGKAEKIRSFHNMGLEKLKEKIRGK